MLEKVLGQLSNISENFYNKARHIEWENKNYIISDKAVLTINCTDRCNAYCFFCYNSITFMKKKSYLNPDSEKISKAYAFARRAGIKIVSYTGGEPTLEPEKLLSLVEMGKASGFEKLRLHTNGFYLTDRMIYQGEEKSLAEHLFGAGLNEISISLASNVSDVNRMIMKLDTKGKVEELLHHGIPEGLKIRLSCFICELGIYTFDQMLGYIKWGIKLGVKNFIFRMTDNSNENVIQRRMLEYVKEFLKKGYHLTFSHQKSDSYIYEFESVGCRVALNYATEEPDPDQKIRRLIVMPDEVIYTSWIFPVSYLFKEDKEILLQQCMDMNGDILNDNSRCSKYPAEVFWKKKVAAMSGQQETYTVDLHVHSLVSDGKISPCAVIEKLKHAGIRQAVFTEHNSFHDDFQQIQNYASVNGVKIPFQGVEINTVYCKEPGIPYMKFHLLIYGENIEKGRIAQRINNINQVKNQYIVRQYEKLKEKGLVKKALDELYHIDDIVGTKKKMYTRSQIAREIQEVTGISELRAKEKYLPQIADEERYRDWIDIQEMIEIARQEGAVTILAHPGWLRPFSRETLELTNKELISAIIDMKRWGLDGIEVTHRLNQSETRVLLKNTALTLGMLTTGGSDYHANKNCVIGINGTTEEELREISRILKQRKKELKENE